MLLLPCDVADDAAVRAMLHEVDDEFGGLEVLINNAGTTVATPPKDMDAVTRRGLGSSVSPSMCAGCFWSRALPSRC